MVHGAWCIMAHNELIVDTSAQGWQSRRRWLGRSAFQCANENMGSLCTTRTHARTNASTQARRHAFTHARTQAFAHAGTQARTQARKHARTHAYSCNEKRCDDDIPAMSQRFIFREQLFLADRTHIILVNVPRFYLGRRTACRSSCVHLFLCSNYLAFHCFFKCTSSEMCVRHVSTNEATRYRFEWAVWGVGASYQCPRINQDKSNQKKKHEGHGPRSSCMTSRSTRAN